VSSGHGPSEAPAEGVGRVGRDEVGTVSSGHGPPSTTSGTPGRRRVLLVAAAALAVVGVVLVAIAVGAQRSAPAAVDAGPLPAVATALPAPPASPVPAGSVRSDLPTSPPTRIVVPTIGVDSPVSSVGLNPDRTMEVPAKGPDYDLAAWYRYSVTPGQRGPSVIIGHIDSREEGPSVFFELGRVRPGQQVEVTRADGARLAFDVYAVRTVPKDAFPTDEVYGGTAGPELRLITCGGSFDAADRNYRDNVVVFARLRP
jgi:hypothetical protein